MSEPTALRRRFSDPEAARVRAAKFEQQGADSVHVEWRPAESGDEIFVTAWFKDAHAAEMAFLPDDGGY